MTIQDLYTRYQIMPQLSEHMRRVAGVGQLILGGWKDQINTDLIMRTLLLHDIGNMAKFDLTDEGQKKLGSNYIADLPYWRSVQATFWDKYGHDAHEATITIINEIGGQDDVSQVLTDEHDTYVANSRGILQSPIAEQVLLYCDARVTPEGVVPLKVRIADLARRYAARDNRDLSWFDFLYELEDQVQTMTTTDLQNITKASVEPLLDKLLTYVI